MILGVVVMNVVVCGVIMNNFTKELETLINKYSKDNESDTPDFILAQYLINCLQVFKVVVKDRDAWYGNAFGTSNWITRVKKEPYTPGTRYGLIKRSNLVDK